MFIQNVARLLYTELINEANKRLYSDNIYLEKHHIIPLCLGGKNNSKNKVYLTYDEHKEAHRLLTLFVIDKHKKKMYDGYTHFYRNLTIRHIKSVFYKKEFVYDYVMSQNIISNPTFQPELIWRLL